MVEGKVPLDTEVCNVTVHAWLHPHKGCVC